MREWLQQNYMGEKSQTNSLWIEIWNAATEEDFALPQCGSHTQTVAMMANSDPREIKLERIVSEEYDTRTGDHVGAAEMMAVRPPGVQSCVAPTWLVTEATAHSKAEHQRNERVRGPSAPRRPRGGGAPSGRGAGTAKGDAAQQGDDDGGGKARGRGRGRK
jgi:hypothetical protein